MSDSLNAISKVLVYLVMILSIGASGSILLLFVWVSSLNISTNQIILNQKESRDILAGNQKAIKENQEIIKEGIADIRSLILDTKTLSAKSTNSLPEDCMD